MTRFIRINDGVTIPGVELVPELKKGYVFDAVDSRSIEGTLFFIGPDGTAHSKWDIERHDLPTEAEVIDHIMNYTTANGYKTERRDDAKIDRIAELVAKMVTGQKVTLENIGK